MIDDLIFDWWIDIIKSRGEGVDKQPPFEINERIMADVIEIAELVGRVSVTDKISMNPTLRRTNRIQTEYKQYVPKLVRELLEWTEKVKFICWLKAVGDM